MDTQNDTHSNSQQTAAEPRTETSGTSEQAFRAAEGLAAGPELNTHGTKAFDAREETGHKATDDWKNKSKHTDTTEK